MSARSVASIAASRPPMHRQERCRHQRRMVHNSIWAKAGMDRDGGYYRMYRLLGEATGTDAKASRLHECSDKRS